MQEGFLLFFLSTFFGVYYSSQIPTDEEDNGGLLGLLQLDKPTKLGVIEKSVHQASASQPEESSRKLTAVLPQNESVEFLHSDSVVTSTTNNERNTLPKEKEDCLEERDVGVLVSPRISNLPPLPTTTESIVYQGIRTETTFTTTVHWKTLQHFLTVLTTTTMTSSIFIGSTSFKESTITKTHLFVLTVPEVWTTFTKIEKWVFYETALSLYSDGITIYTNTSWVTETLESVKTMDYWLISNIIGTTTQTLVESEVYDYTVFETSRKTNHKTQKVSILSYLTTTKTLIETGELLQTSFVTTTLPDSALPKLTVYTTV